MVNFIGHLGWYNSLQLNHILTCIMQANEAELISQIKIYKSKIVLQEYQLQNFIKYLDQTVFKKFFFFCSPNKVSLAPSFQRAFSTLTQIQKADYYLSSLKIIHQFNKLLQFVEQKKHQSESYQVQYRKQGEEKLWKKTTITLHYNTICLQVQALNTRCNLCNYIIRKSKSKNKNAFVLQSTRAQCQPITLRISHINQSQLKSLITKMKALMKMGLRKKIARMMKLQSKGKQLTDQWQIKREYMSVKLASDIPLQHKSIRQILRTKSQEEGNYAPEKIYQKIPIFLVSQEIINQIDNFSNFQEISSGFFIHKTRERIKKMFYYNAVTISLAKLDSILFNYQTFKQWKRSLCSISLIGDLPQQKTKFFHEINLYKDGSEVDFVYMRHRFQKNGMFYFVDKSVATAEYGSHQNTNSRGKIEYALWRLRQKSNQVIEAIVQIQITHLPCVDIYKAMSEQIGQLQNIPSVKKMQMKVKKKVPQKISFFSVDQGNIQISIQLLNELQSYEGVMLKKSRNSSSEEGLNGTQQFYSIRNSSSEFQDQQFLSLNPINPPTPKKQVKKAQYYQLEPLEKGVSQLKKFKQECFFDSEECVVNQIGDLVFTNQMKIKSQGTVIKTILKKMGANLFTGKSILNVSLPIQIFSVDTNLQRLCRSMAYAPHFLENKGKSSPLERMKAAICFALGNLLLYIQMAKPFNPILGETYQGFIDGCPVYGQQISHNPPIGVLYLVGRGYKVSASIEAKVDLGLNSVTGSNEGQYHITFNSDSSPKSGIMFTSPPGQLSGMIYGERKLNIIDKSRFLDTQNRLFCELSWGKSRGANTVGRYHDYVQGKIVEMNRPISNINKIKQSEKDIVLGHITGRWTQFIYFNGQPIFEVNKLQPYKVIQELNQLPSDSHFREDRMLLQQYKFKEGQTAKERLEQQQRVDRKLRKQYGF